MLNLSQAAARRQAVFGRVFVGIQMAWVMRPFVGSPHAPVQFLRPESWGNAYVAVARVIYDALIR